MNTYARGSGSGWRGQAAPSSWMDTHPDPIPEPEGVYPAVHKHVFDSDLGEQATYFGHLVCTCGKSMMYQTPVEVIR